MGHSARCVIVSLVIVVAASAGESRAVTTAEDAAGGCDGIKNGAWGFHTASKGLDPWWQVDLGKTYQLDHVVIFNRTEGNCASRTRNIRILVAGGDGDDGGKQFRQVYQHNGSTFYGVKEGKPLVVGFKDKGVSARIVRLAVSGPCSFALDEVEVYAVDDPAKNVALKKPADQNSTSAYSYPGTLPAAAVASIRRGASPAAAPPKAVSQGTARDSIDRATRLVARLRHSADPQRLDPLADELQQLERRVVQMEQSGNVSGAAGEQIAEQARKLKRKIAFSNPLLAGIDKLLFIKRHDAGGPYHMCDQYYDCNARPGGGMFVLENPFGDEPRLINLLENSIVEEGRLKGQKLDSGSFLSPEVSFDGKTILFAYSECKATKTYTWAPEFCYHIFKVNADGTGLVQLTDGPWDDFDPCFLPSGRIAFTTLRRGGYLRCGRHCPVYTVFSMEPDGSDIICLSFHETHEWHPSVNNDGMLVYTRWDYVDRDTNVAHHIWLSYPDGRDPRSYHGNYPIRRESRPWMEMDIRAIPGSHRYVATAASHHGHAFGSLVLIDHRIEDDRAMSQLERLTPEVPFPESTGRGKAKEQYATAWPLSEDDYLCVYDPRASKHAIYWIDREGNKERIYGDDSILCLSPIPLQPRPMPPLIPDATTQTARAKKAAGQDRQATVAVMNIYDGDFQWPAGTKITHLRVIELLPKSTAPPNQPRIGVANQTNARAVLGTVPVEKDGSVLFEAPVGKAIYFQALNEQGMAVQSMRSVTYVHPGERLSCQGCHERKHRPPSHPLKMPLAMRRAPSKLKPDVSGSNPFNYPRLVQAVLDRNCVECHREKKALDLSGAVDGGFTRSYNNLAGKYGFYFHVHNGSIKTGIHGGSRTIPGKFGAMAAPLLKYLGKEHYDVKLSPEDFHRLTLWLDCNSEFLGAYEDAAAQARGEIVEPSLH